MSSDNGPKAIVKVNYGSGLADEVHVGATDFRIADGHLMVDTPKDMVAAYAPGKWLSVKLVPPAA